MIKKFYKKVLTKLFWGLFRFFLNDRQYARFRYWLELDERPNLEQPKKFTEKIQYLKLHERTELRKVLANRTKVRELVARRVGEEHLVPLIGVYDELKEDLWRQLPNQFVLKANHGCGMLAIIRDKQNESYQKVRRKTRRWKRTNYAAFGREWAYRGLPRTIVAEQLLLDSKGSIPKDYKFFCFHGKVEVIQIDFDRFGNQRRNLYDRRFNRLQARLLYPPYSGSVSEPENLQEAISLAETLSRGLSFVRVDLYLMEDQIYLGEMTNYPGNGFIPFEPERMEYKMGKLLKLN